MAHSTCPAAAAADLPARAALVVPLMVRGAGRALLTEPAGLRMISDAVKTELRARAPSSLALLADDRLRGEIPADDLAALRSCAREGRAFVLSSDDPVTFRVDVYVDEGLPEPVETLFSGRSGAFLLLVPSGRLTFETRGDRPEGAAEPHLLEVPPADYAVSVLDRTDPDVHAHEARLETLCGPADWRFFRSMNRLGLLGCAGVALAAILAVIPPTRRSLWFLLPLLLSPQVVFLLLNLHPRYRRVRRIQSEAEAALPTHVIVMRRTAAGESLEGGWVNV